MIGRRTTLTLGAASLLALSACARPVAGEPSAAAGPVTVTATATAVVTTSPASTTAPATATTAQAEATLTPPPNPCQLVTRAEAETLADRALQDAVPSGDEKGVPTLCEYTAPPDSPGVAQVSIGVGDGALKFLQIDRDTLGHTFTRPKDIGDEAWLEDGHIFVRKGSTWASVELVTLDDDSEIPQRLQDVGRIIAGRLG